MPFYETSSPMMWSSRSAVLDFFSIIVSDVTVTVGCSNILRCCEVWCSRRGEWWRRQAYKQTGQTRRLNRPPPHVASYWFTLSRVELFRFVA